MSKSNQVMLMESAVDYFRVIQDDFSKRIVEDYAIAVIDDDDGLVILQLIKRNIAFSAEMIKPGIVAVTVDQMSFGRELERAIAESNVPHAWVKPQGMLAYSPTALSIHFEMIDMVERRQYVGRNHMPYERMTVEEFESVWSIILEGFDNHKTCHDARPIDGDTLWSILRHAYYVAQSFYSEAYSDIPAKPLKK